MKRLVVVSHKVCWPCLESASGYATDGGFPLQMRAISELFEETVLVVPCAATGSRPGEMELTGSNLRVCPVSLPGGRGWRRKVRLPGWLLRNLTTILKQVRRADAVHAPIPGDLGTIGMLLATLFRKPLFVRHCGNWFVQRTIAERFWKWFMESFAGGRNVMLATGGACEPPSTRNPSIRWIFSSTLSKQDLSALASSRQFNPRPRRLIIMCRQEPGKGTDKVIETLALLKDQFPEITLDVVGGGSGLSGFRQLAADLGVAGRVTFHGQQSRGRALELLRHADLFCYPTASEGFPKAVIEAMACGLPVVTTPVSVLPQLVAPGGGVILDVAAPSQIADRVAWCLAEPARLQSMSAIAMQTAQAFTLERWRDEIGYLLNSAWRHEAPCG